MLNLCANTTSNVSIFMLSLLDLPFLIRWRFKNSNVKILPPLLGFLI